MPLKSSKNTSASSAQTVNDVVGTVRSDQMLFELDGYSTCIRLGGPGYQDGLHPIPTTTARAPTASRATRKGPKYYGNTFMIWPPDPRRGLCRPLSVPNSLQEFGYGRGSMSVEPTTSEKRLQGIWTANGQTSNGQTALGWPWPADGVKPQAYLQRRPARPVAVGSPLQLSASDSAEFQSTIMILHDRL